MPSLAEEGRCLELEKVMNFFRHLSYSKFLSDTDKEIMDNAVNALCLMQTCLTKKDESKREDRYSHYLSESLRDLRTATDALKKINSDKIDSLKAVCLDYQDRSLTTTDIQKFIPILKYFIPDQLENFITGHCIPPLELSEKQQLRIVFSAALLLADELQKAKERTQVETKDFFNKFKESIVFLTGKAEETIQCLEKIVDERTEDKEKVGLISTIAVAIDEFKKNLKLRFTFFTQQPRPELAITSKDVPSDETSVLAVSKK